MPKVIREFGLAFLAVALVARVWPEFWGVDEGRGTMGFMSPVTHVIGISVALVFAAHLLPARIGAERMADRQGQFGPKGFLHAGVGVLAGVAISGVGSWGGPVGLGIALAALALSGRAARTGGDAES